ncbi:hypothetical protein [Methylobacterium sp. A54F]
MPAAAARGAFLPALAGVPLAAALLALGLAAATGFDQRGTLPPLVERHFYGFFLDRYPLAAFALVYGLAHILVLGLGPGPAGWPRRLLGTAVGLCLLTAAGLYPTFGGVILRSGFATGGVAFLQGLPMAGAYALGAAATAFSFGGILALSAIMANRALWPRAGWRRAVTGTLASLVLRFLALWFAAALLGLAPSLGFGPWPHRAMRLPEAGIGAVLLVVGFIPHAILNGRRLRRPHRTR